MVYYIASSTYNQTIYSTIKEQEEIIVGQQVNNHVALLKFFKTNINTLSNIDFFIIDTSALDDTEEEILQAIKMYRTINEDVRIIVFSPERTAGDSLLSQVFSLGIWNIIGTLDYLEIKSQLIVCLSEKGKSFKEALEYKDIKKLEQTEQKEIKTVNKVILGVAGSQAGIGSTHNAVVLAGSLRKKGFLVAIAEANQSSDFEKVRKDFGMKIHEHSYFVMNGIDYYPDVTEQTIKRILEKSYNFIVMDFGSHVNCNQALYDKCHARFLIAGSKAWELEYVSQLLTHYNDEELKKINFYFNFTDKEYEKPIKKEMRLSDGKPLNVHFLDYHSDPFNTYEFPDINIVLEDYLPTVKKKNGFFLRKKI